MKTPPQRILICCIRLIGDVILTTPLVKILKDRWPNAEIDFLVNAGTGDFLKKDPNIRKVISIPNKEFRSNLTQESHYMREILLKYDLAINTNASDRGSIAARLATRKTCLTCIRPNERKLKLLFRKALFSHLSKQAVCTHIVLNNLRIAESLNLHPNSLHAYVCHDANNQQVVENIFTKANLHKPAYFVIHPFARWKYKYWKPERFAEVSDYIAEKHSLVPVWTSSPDKHEVSLIQALSEKANIKPLLIPGSLNLNQMSYLLSQAKFYLGLDTAISHIAATHDIPMLVLFGPTIAQDWGPWNNQGKLSDQYPRENGVFKNGKICVIQSNDNNFTGIVEAQDQYNTGLMNISVNDVKRCTDDVLI